MTTIHVHSNHGAAGPAFRAVSNGAEGTGDAPGEAIDALLAQTGRPTGTAIIVLRPFGPDDFFPAPKRDRLADLMRQFRAARDAGTQLAPTVRAELDALIDEELAATVARSAAMLQAARSHRSVATSSTS